MIDLYLSLSFQVVVEKAPKSSIQDIDKRKFLVPSDLTGKIAINGNYCELVRLNSTEFRPLFQLEDDVCRVLLLTVVAFKLSPSLLCIILYRIIVTTHL